jgi:D-alanine-D-alanine ligase
MKYSKAIKIGVLMGGPCLEHETSLIMGQNILKHLDLSKYKPMSIKISKKGQWFFNGKLSDPKSALKYCDLIINALLGPFGESGRIQALIEYYGVRYTGSGIAASALAADKLRSREIFKLAGFSVPKTLKIKAGENYHARLNFFVTKIVKPPLVIKPCSSSFSMGVKIVYDITDLEKLEKIIDETFNLDKKVLVEEYIKGREVACGVIDNFDSKETAALPVTEIIVSDGLIDYENNNYKEINNRQTKFITPANIDITTRDEVQSIAVRVHQILGCNGYSLTDMILKNDNIYILEVNTLPPITFDSIIYQELKAINLDFGRFLDKIIENSLK